MKSSEMSKLVAEAEGLLGQLHGDAVRLLRDFDTATLEDFDETLKRREVVLERFHAVDHIIRSQNNDPGPDGVALLDEYNLLREEIIKKILEADSLVMALAQEQLSTIKGELAAMAKGKNALHAYEKSGMIRSNILNDSA